MIPLRQQKMDRGSNSILKMKLEAFPSWDRTKTKGKLALRTAKSEKGEEVLPSTKERKNHTKTSTQRERVAIEVPFYPRR